MENFCDVVILPPPPQKPKGKPTVEKYVQLLEKKRLLKEKMQELSTEEMQDYINMDISLDELEKNMFESRE